VAEVDRFIIKLSTFNCLYRATYLQQFHDLPSITSGRPNFDIELVS
jgi:hypothetical protein